jgi:hypothetical protein
LSDLTYQFCGVKKPPHSFGSHVHLPNIQLTNPQASGGGCKKKVEISWIEGKFEIDFNFNDWIIEQV